MLLVLVLALRKSFFSVQNWTRSFNSFLFLYFTYNIVHKKIILWLLFRRIVVPILPKNVSYTRKNKRSFRLFVPFSTINVPILQMLQILEVMK